MYKCTYFSQQPNCNVRVEFLIDAVHEQFRRSMRFHVSLTHGATHNELGFNELSAELDWILNFETIHRLKYYFVAEA